MIKRCLVCGCECRILESDLQDNISKEEYKMKEVFFGMVLLSSVMLADFSRSSEGIVTDNITTLQWQDDYSDNGGSVKIVVWEAAIDYCEALTLGGYDDWRLPNINELKSIIDRSRFNPAIVSVFEYTSNKYWSSTTSKDNDRDAWNVYFSYGTDSWDHKDNSGYVRCVRDGQ